MFETSLGLLLKHLILNLIIPFIPWLFFIRIFYGQKFKWLLLYILSRFLWAWVIGFSLLNIQLIYFWLWIREYFIILILLLFILILKIYFKKQSIKSYIKTLKIKNIFPEIKTSFVGLSIIEKIFTIIMLIYSFHFICISGIYCFNLPTYGVDSFPNRNGPAFSIYLDWWIKYFWEKSEILWRWRLWYPIQIPAYKALLSDFAWWLNDIYFNIRQRFVFLFWLLFIFSITFDKTKNLFKSMLPIWLIISMPLIYFHSFDWYMDLPNITYCMISARMFYLYLEKNDFDYFSLGLLFWIITAYIKNDGFVVYFPWLLIALFIILFLKKRLKSTIKWFLKDKDNLLKSIWYIIYFFLPFLIIKIINGLWFNQAAWDLQSWIWLSKVIHWKIFPFFWHMFFELDNYNLILIILLLIFVAAFYKKKISDSSMLFLYTAIIVFLILIAVFLFTKDYEYLLNQTTGNRVFTMCFIVILGFCWFLLDGANKNEKTH